MNKLHFGGGTKICVYPKEIAPRIAIGISIMQREVIRVIKESSRDGMQILLLEQNGHYALMNSDEDYVLENGGIMMEGSGKELLSDRDVKTAYLGF